MWTVELNERGCEQGVNLRELAAKIAKMYDNRPVPNITNISYYNDYVETYVSQDGRLDFYMEVDRIWENSQCFKKEYA